METKPPDNFLYEYSVVRYVPRVDREEFINIGLLMMCKRQRWLKGRVELDKARILAIDPKADVDKLRNQCQMFHKNDIPKADLPTEEKYRWMASVKNMVIQTSPSHPGKIIVSSSKDKTDKEILEEEFERLFGELVKI